MIFSIKPANGAPVSNSRAGRRRIRFSIVCVERYRSLPICWYRRATTWKSARPVRTPFSTVFMHDRIGTPVNWALSAVGRACLAHCPDKEPASWVATRENGVGSQSVGLEAVGVIAQFPIGRLCLKAQGFITGKWRNAVATMRACLFGESFGYVFVSKPTIRTAAWRAISGRSRRIRCRASR
jgi:hypothetical protein